MIGSLRGRLTSKQAPAIVLECSGVGYELETPMSTFFQLPAIGQEVFLHTHMVVREDAQNLFGFLTVSERLLFRTLLKISGVGARMGLAILSGMTAAEFKRCVEFEDTAMLVKIPGVGKKTAERLIIEMRDRIDKALPSAAAPGGGIASEPRNEAFNALLALGYKAAEINRLMGKVNAGDKSAEDIIRESLQMAGA